jgi:hypothetical protein
MMKAFKISVILFIIIEICLKIYVVKLKTITDPLEPWVNDIYTFIIAMVTLVNVIIYLITPYITKPIIRLIFMLSAYFLFVSVTTLMLRNIFFPGFQF